MSTMCQNCGEKILTPSQSCGNCGKPVTYRGGPNWYEKVKKKKEKREQKGQDESPYGAEGGSADTKRGSILPTVVNGLKKLFR